MKPTIGCPLTSRGFKRGSENDDRIPYSILSRKR